MVCIRFSASSNTTDIGPSIISFVTSYSLTAGRQCINIVLSLPEASKVPVYLIRFKQLHSFSRFIFLSHRYPYVGIYYVSSFYGFFRVYCNLYTASAFRGILSAVLKKRVFRPKTLRSRYGKSTPILSILS